MDMCVLVKRCFFSGSFLYQKSTEQITISVAWSQFLNDTAISGKLLIFLLLLLHEAHSNIKNILIYSLALRLSMHYFAS